MAKLKHSFTQNNLRGVAQSTLVITVEYDPSEKVVDDIISVEVYNHAKRIHTDITYIFSEQFEKQLNGIVDSIDWSQIYVESLEPIYQS